MPEASRRPVRLLLVEDRVADAELLVAELTAGGFDCTWTRVETADALRSALDEPVDAVLADFRLPHFTGLEALSIVRERHPDLPFILVSGTIGESLAVEAVKNGADDYLLKDRLARLALALGQALHERHNRREAARAQRELVDQKMLLQSVLDNMVDGVFVVDEQGSWVLVNPAALELIGGPPTSTDAGSIPDDLLIDPESGDPMKPEDMPLSRAVRGLSTTAREIRIVRRRREPRSIVANGRPIFDASGKVTGGLATWRDVTEERKEQEARRQSDIRFQELFWNDLVGHFVSTPDGRLLECNPAFASMFGFESVDEALRTGLGRLYQRGEDRDHYVGLVREQRELRQFESAHIRGDGRVIHTVENTTGRFDEEGHLIAIHGSIIDVTAMREAEQQLRQSQKMEAVGQLAGGVAHDFNNLLTIVLGYAEQLRDDSEVQTPEQCRACVGEIVTAAQRGAALTRQLLTFSRQQPLTPGRLDVNDVIRGLEPMLRRLVGERASIVVDLSTDPLAIKADTGGLEQLVTNLVVNARDAMPSGGTIRIETRAESGNESVTLTVSDDGLGMDETTRGRIFEPFFTTKPRGKGTGLGLSVVFGIVKHSGGSIAVESTVGVGTRFRVSFPAANADSDTAPPPEAAPPASLDGRETVLVVEDESEVRQLIRAVLESRGYRVVEAENGAEAIVVLEHSPPPALVITDVVMPRLGGVGLAQSLAIHHPATKVLFMSGYPPQSDRLSIDERRYLPKPFTPIELLRKVRAVLDDGA